MFEDVNWRVVVQTIILSTFLFVFCAGIVISLFREFFPKKKVEEDVMFNSDITYTLQGCKPCKKSSRLIQLNGIPSVRVKVCDKHVESHRRQRLVHRIEKQHGVTIH